MTLEGGTEVVRTYLELLRPEQLVPAPNPDPRARVERVERCPPSLYRYFYAEVGRDYHWVDRLAWSDERISAHLVRPEILFWVLDVAGARAGYFELARHDDGSTEIAYFGLLPEFQGLGFGKYLLTVAVERAFQDGARRVWLHTCTLDHVAAMPNYRARGFRPFKREKYRIETGPEHAKTLSQQVVRVPRPK